MNTKNTYSSAGLIVVQVHKAATLIPGPSTVVLLPLSDINKSLGESATHIVTISLYSFFTKTWANFDNAEEQDAVTSEDKAIGDGKDYTMKINCQFSRRFVITCWPSFGFRRRVIDAFPGVAWERTASTFKATESRSGGCLNCWKSGPVSLQPVFHSTHGVLGIRPLQSY